MNDAPVLYLPDGNQYIAKASAVAKAGFGGIGVDGLGPGMGEDSTVSSVIASGQGARIPDLDVYAMLAMKHPTVQTCVTLIADAVSTDGWDIAPRGHEDAKPISAEADKRVGEIQTFFDIASPVVTDRGRRFMLAADIKSFGFSILRKRRAGRIVAALERVDPRTIVIKPNADQTAVAQYLIRKRQANGLFMNNNAEAVDPADIIFFSATGGDPMQGFASPLEALDLTLATDFAQRRFREAFCRLGAKAGMVLTSDEYDEEAFKAAEAQIQKSRVGADNAYKTLLLPGGWKMVKAPNAGQDDADFVKATGLNKEDVAGVYRVPMGMITYSGNALGSSGKGDDRAFFEQFACLPLEEIIYERLTMSLLRDEFKITDLAIVPKRRNRVRFDMFDAAIKAVQFGFTGNESRRLVNAPPITDTRYNMDAPLFLGKAFANGIAGQEPLDPSTPDTGLNNAGGEGSAEGSVTAAEVAQKGKARFRGRRPDY